MSEYWVSTAKRYCDACKCYISDDKTVIQVHEQGKRHKENVAKRLAATAKKGAEIHAEQTAYDEQMAAIEKAALEAIKKDGSSIGEQDKRDFNRIMKRRDEERAQAALSLPASSCESTEASSYAYPSPYENIKTPDETKGIAGGWVTVSVTDVSLKEEKTEVEKEPTVEDIPLPPPVKIKKSKFGVKEVTLDPSESSADVDESDVKKAFGGFKRKANRGNMRQRTDD